MKSIIIYESKHGTTKKCADYVKENKRIQNLSLAKDYKGNLEEYDEIILCTPVYMGKINKYIKELIDSNENVLLSKKVTIIISAMNVEEYDAMISNNLSSVLIENVTIIYAGGGYNFESMNFLSKAIVKKMTGYTSSYENILYDNLNRIVE